ncbi:hypothetical protein IV203_037650 [Nitzschia inconspicua]|uniref:Uncharacterized protein n=1 Tax=Nitzschia inconspicua TaxID=303405 RepID=A0A9K3LLC2_9STRA|nr:hypothetical protein IV203_037650 [Nitzschia inconspicua]
MPGKVSDFPILCSNVPIRVELCFWTMKVHCFHVEPRCLCGVGTGAEARSHILDQRPRMRWLPIYVYLAVKKVLDSIWHLMLWNGGVLGPMVQAPIGEGPGGQGSNWLSLGNCCAKVDRHVVVIPVVFLPDFFFAQQRQQNWSSESSGGIGWVILDLRYPATVCDMSQYLIAEGDSRDFLEGGTKPHARQNFPTP